jgi:ABC-type branched-subunit amino acid transport system ATPase component
VTSALNDIKGKVDAISTFPAETEKPIVSSMQFRGQTISVTISGRTDEATLKLIADDVRDDISALDGISQVAVNYARPWEISIEVSEQILRKYPRLAERRKHAAGVLSGGERRLLEISRALVMGPEVLLVDEPSIGLEPRFIDMVFGILDDLQREEGKTIVMVEQNAKRGLEFADIGYVMVSGNIAIAGSGDELLENPDVGRLFLGG